MKAESRESALEQMDALTAPEQRKLEQLEAIIQEGQDTYLRVGLALLEIRDGRLYREQYKTFEAYCRERWQFNRYRASQLIDAANIVASFGTVPDHPDVPADVPACEDGQDLSTMVDKVSLQTESSTDVPLPKNERQARALKEVAPEQRLDVWREAVKSAPKGTDGKPKVTAKHVEKVVAQRRQPEGESPAEPWADTAAAIDAVVSDLRSVSTRLRVILRVEDGEITNPYAKRYSQTGTTGAVNAIVRYLIDNKPVGMDERGVITHSDQVKATRRSA